VADPPGVGEQLTGRLREPLSSGDSRFVDYAPLLTWAECQPEPWKLYARITLIASGRQNATFESASFTVERGLLRVLRPGDQLHVSRTPCAGLGLSILRSDHLVAAAGAITSVPLGVDVSVRHPWDLIREAERIFRTRDTEYHVRESPIELWVDGVTRIMHAGRPRIGPYDILIRHGFVAGTPGTDECVSIERCGVCPDTAAHTSAQLLEEHGLKIRH
jgi:hypothetical protein